MVTPKISLALNILLPQDTKKPCKVRQVVLGYPSHEGYGNHLLSSSRFVCAPVSGRGWTTAKPKLSRWL